MPVLNDELKLINNPVLGAYLLWCYSSAYRNYHKEQAPSPGLLLFIILPIIFHKPTLDFLDRTRSTTGLNKFALKFLDTAQKRSDLLLNIHRRAQEMKGLSMEALKIAIAKGLLFIDTPTGNIIPKENQALEKPKKNPQIIEMMQKNCEKLGLWFSQSSIQDISFSLKVYF